MTLRRSPQTAQVLGELLRAPREWSYGYDLSRSTGLKSGTLYPILMRLAEHRLLETSWEKVEEGRPPRHLYRLTSDGLRYAREQAAERHNAAPARAARNIRRPAFGEVTG
jgi:DNA-binding PadR family transcriptional regulator